MVLLVNVIEHCYGDEKVESNNNSSQLPVMDLFGQSIFMLENPSSERNNILSVNVERVMKLNLDLRRLYFKPIFDCILRLR